MFDLNRELKATVLPEEANTAAFQEMLRTSLPT